MNALASILVPVYNREKWLGNCLNSLVNQTYGNIEIVIYDDGSTDNSLDIIKSFMKQDSRIRLIAEKENKGVSEARRRLLEAYKGKYVFFVDSDDTIDLRTVEKAVAIMEKENVDLVYYRIRLNKGICCMPQIKRYLPNGKHNIDFVKKYYLKNPVNLFYSSLCNKCYKASILEQCGNNIETVMEDVFYNIKYLSLVQKCYVLPDFLYIYNQTNESMTRKAKKENLIHAYKERWEIDRVVFDRIRKAFNVTQGKEAIDLVKYFYIRYVQEMRIHFKDKRAKNAFMSELEVSLNNSQVRFFFWNLIVYKKNIKVFLKRTIKNFLKIS